MLVTNVLPDMRTVITRGAMGLCPNCGKGPLFRTYLKQIHHCQVCAESFKDIRADDAPPWLTILIAGHVIVPIILIVEPWSLWPQWVSLMLWPVVISLFSLIVLPRAKGVFLAVIWATRAPGFEP